MNVTTTDRFTIRDAAELYGLPAWGARYLSISEDGDPATVNVEGSHLLQQYLPERVAVVVANESEQHRRATLDVVDVATPLARRIGTLMENRHKTLRGA